MRTFGENKVRKLAVWLLMGACGYAATTTAATFYRYTNEKGVVVIDYQVPPKFAYKGYEVVNEAGRVLKVVDPALSGDELKALEENQSLEKWDQELRRRYSSARDVDIAKQRKLEQVQGRLSIIESNIRNLKAQIGDQHAKAAESDRMGREVPEPILQKLENLHKELLSAQAQLSERQEQLQLVDQKYERDKARLLQITQP